MPLHEISRGIPPWTTYTPTWTSTGTPPAIGNGTLQGAYRIDGNIITARFQFLAGTTTTYGTGTYTFSYPFPEVTTSGVEVTGTGIAFDSSTGAIYVAHWRAQQLLTLASPVALYSNTVPFTWATSDQLQMQIVYAIA